MNRNLWLAGMAVFACLIVAGAAPAALTPIVNASMSATTADEFDGWVNTEIVADGDNIRFHNLASASSSGFMTLSGQLEFSQAIGTVDADGNGLEFGVEIGKGTGASFSGGYDFEVRIGGGALVKAADNSIDPPTWNTSAYAPVISFTAAELAPFVGQTVELYGASRHSGGTVGATLGFDNWTATVVPPPPPLPQVDSTDFAYQYEFDVQPRTLDLDGNSTDDFWSGWDIGTISSGVSSVAYTDNDQVTGGRVATDFGGSIWRDNFLSGDWTVEVGLQITTADGAEGSTGSIALLLATNADNQENFWLRVGREDMRVTLPGGALQTVDTSDNTSDIVAVRVARRDDKHYIWRDGVLLNASEAPADGFDWAPNTVGSGAAGLRTGFSIDGRYFSSSLNGSVDFDYFRMDPDGAMAPVPEPSTLVLVLIGLIGIGRAARRR